MKISQEEQFLKIIRFTPAIFLIIISSLVIVLLYFENKNTFETEKKELEEKFISENKQQIKDEVVKVKQFVRDVQSKMYSEYRDESENIDKDEFTRIVQENVLNYISMIRYGKSGYIFVITYDGIYLNHARKSFIGKHYLDNNDTKNIAKVIEDLTQIAKNGGGYYSYIQNYKPGTEHPTEKISYVEGLDDWKWMIGTGFYEDEVQEEINKLKNKLDERYKNYVKNIVFSGIFLIIILLIISKYMSNFLAYKLKQYKDELNKNQSILHQQAKMAAMGEMIGNIAHQWRQPLSTITTASSGMVLQKDLGILTDEFFYDASNKINTSAQYLSQTIDDFRNFFSTNREKSKFLLADTIQVTLDLISAQFSTKDIVVIKNIETVELYNYENELIQALINILNNARDELLKKLPGEERFIFVDVYKDEENTSVVIEISDNAGGIKEEIIEKVFEPYFTTKHKSQGTGIGLYMTEEIITKHLDGKVSVENKTHIHNQKEYTGASFKISLPLYN